jgi:hypothetical protein
MKMEKTRVKFQGGVERVKTILGKCQNLATKYEADLHSKFSPEIWSQHEKNLNQKLDELEDLQNLKSKTGVENKTRNSQQIKFIGQLRNLIAGNLGNDSADYPAEIIPFVSGRVERPSECLKVLWGYVKTNPADVPVGSKVGVDAIEALLLNDAGESRE